MAESKKTVSAAKTEKTETTKSAAKPSEPTKKPDAAVVKATAESAARKAEAAVKKVESSVQKAEAKVQKSVKTARSSAKKAVKKAAPRTAKKKEVDSEVFIQYDNKSISSGGLVERVREIWKERGYKADELKEIKVYVNVAESKAYYVLNEDTFGEFAL